MVNLNPIEKLQLLDIQEEGYFNTKNKLYCLLYQLYKKKKLIFNNNKFQVKEFDKDELNIIYEEEFARLLKSKRYYELQEWLNKKCTFKKTLIRNNLIREHVKKGRFSIFNKSIIEKTEEFFEIYDDIKKKEYESNKKIINIICEDNKEDENIRKLVDKILMDIQKMTSKK